MARRTPWSILITCEHGGNTVPREYRALFRGAAAVLRSHRGLDIGALATARHFQRALDAPLIAATVTRLLVDLNRSPGHKTRFSEFTRDLPVAERRRIIERWWSPYWQLVAGAVKAELARGGRVLHLSVHSFTPQLHGVTRNAEIGFLYDPARRIDAEFCCAWRAALEREAPRWRVRMNYPYRGTSDGLTTQFRKRYPAARYLAMELELNQGALADGRRRARLLADLVGTMPAPR
jgi:predicted N-formylglutamate amidohydrolase